ncbi:MAG TPA: phosphotransferase [bacterium]|nr:phosphotransferase [bacterium]
MTTENARDEQPLGAGQLSPVVRVGDTVRRPTGPWTPAVHALLAHLERAGYPGAPRPLGIDDRQREILSFVPGEVPAPDTPPPYVWAESALTGVARLLRRYHDVVADFVPPRGAAWQTDDASEQEREIICHNDVAPWNTGFLDGVPSAFIDWDLAGPGRRLWDVAYALWHFVPLYAEEKCARLGCDPSVDERARRARGFCDAYRLPARADLIDAVLQRQWRARERIRTRAERGAPAFVGLWRRGVAAGILDDLAFVRRNAEALARYVSHAGGR